MKFLKIFIAINLFLCSCNGRLSRVDYDEINSEVLDVIQNKSRYKPRIVSAVDVCDLKILKALELDSEGSSKSIRFFRYNLLEDSPYIGYKIETSEYEIINISGLDIIIGCCCLSRANVTFLVPYYGLIDNGKMARMVASFFIVKESSEFEVEKGCDQLENKLSTIVFNIKSQAKTVVCKN